MERISCPQCEKTFRNETGLNWHLERMHSQSQQTSDQVNNSANLSQAEDAAQLEDIRDSIGALEQRMDNMAASVADFMGRLSHLGELDNQVSALKMNLSSAQTETSKLQSQVRTVEAKLSEASTEIGSVKFHFELHEKYKHPKPRECTGLPHPCLTCQGTKG